MVGSDATDGGIGFGAMIFLYGGGIGGGIVGGRGSLYTGDGGGSEFSGVGTDGCVMVGCGDRLD